MIRDLTYDPPLDPALRLIYEDQDLLAFSKPPGLLTVPGKTPDLSDCLQVRVERAYPEALLLHRLDMETSGLCLFARNKRAQKGLGRQFEKRVIEKTYKAWVWGWPKEDQGLIDQPLICDWPNRPKQKICYERGKPSQTQWQVLKRERHFGDRASLIALTPKTGRSHQLRLHMLWLGHPIWGDSLYADDRVFAASPRMQLHAEKIRFIQPSQGHWLELIDLFDCNF